MLNTKKATLYVLGLLALCACRDSGNDPLLAFGEKPALTRITADQALQQGTEMFDDNETVDELIGSDRHFYVKQPVVASVTADNKLRLANFMAHDFADLNVWLVSSQLTDTLRLVNFEKVPSFYDIRIDLPLTNDETVYETKSGKSVRAKNLALLTPSEYSLLVTGADPIFDLLKTIKMQTKVQLGAYGEGNWQLMNPSGARYLVTGAVNMAVFFSSDAFRDSLMAYPGLLPDNDGNPVDRELLLRQILAKGRLVMGLVKNYEGLGGGDAFGLGPWLFPKMYYQNRVVLDCGWAVDVWIHELGHCIGYAHGSCMCYGIVCDEIGPKVYKDLITKQLLPYVFDPFKTYNDYVPTASTPKQIDENV